MRCATQASTYRSEQVRRRFVARWLGRQRYAPVHSLMERLCSERARGTLGDTVLLVEHDPVITLGRGAHEDHVLFPREALLERGMEVVSTGRGGDVTLHAPGQLVCYPILDLSPDRCDVRRYVGDLRETMRRLAADFGVAGGAADGLIGLWVDAARPKQWHGAEHAQNLAKLGAIGVRLSRWITMHGFAMNLTTDLSLYDLIVPCGISAHGVTSIEALTGTRISPRDLAERAFELLAQVLDAETADFIESEP
jgi:lipoyl(octanoyl) transferase